MADDTRATDVPMEEWCDHHPEWSDSEGHCHHPKCTVAGRQVHVIDAPPAEIAPEQCRYLHAAYPTLDATDTCGEHRHDEPTFSLARAMAEAFQQADPTDEQIGWCMDDAGAVVDDFDPTTHQWSVTEPEVSDEPGLDFTLTINARPYVVQQSEWEPSRPLARSTWHQWRREDDPDYMPAQTEEADRG